MRLRFGHVWLTLAVIVLAGCGARPEALGGGGTLPPLSSLDRLPRVASEVTPQVNGADFIASSGLASAYPHPTQSTWLVLDGAGAPDQTAWAVWRITLSPGQVPESVDVNLPQNGLRRYWIAYADFGTEHWHFLDTGGNAAGQQGASAHIAPADATQLISQGLNMYVAVLVRGGQAPSSLINVGYLEATYTPASGTDPIADDFENNDTLATCYQLPGAGMYHASIHESRNTGMSDPAEFRDKLDFYCIDIPAGKQLTVTLRHEAHDHFNPAASPADYTDLDLLFYPNSAVSPYDDFIEADSSTQVFYGFEQIHLNGASGMFKLGIVPDIDDQYEDNAEYDLGLFYSASTHSVSGKLTQNSTPVDKEFAVFLEPGNFNAVTDFDSGHEGEFSIQGVPDGDYTLKVQGSAGFYQTGWVYGTTLPVSVNGSNVSNQNINIEPYGGP